MKLLTVCIILLLGSVLAVASPDPSPGYQGQYYGSRPYIGPNYYRYRPRGVALHPDGRSYVGPRIHGIGKRSALPSPGYGYYGCQGGYRNPGRHQYTSRRSGVALHPYSGRSYVGRTTHGIGKRSASAYPHELYTKYRPYSRSYTPRGSRYYVSQSSPHSSYYYSVQSKY